MIDIEKTEATNQFRESVSRDRFWLTQLLQLPKNSDLPICFQVTLVVKLNKQVEISISEVKTVARRNGAVIKTFIDRSCTHVVCSKFNLVLFKVLFWLELVYFY